MSIKREEALPLPPPPSPVNPLGVTDQMAAIKAMPSHLGRYELLARLATGGMGDSGAGGHREIVPGGYRNSE